MEINSLKYKNLPPNGSSKAKYGIKVALIKSNPIYYDPKLTKEAKALADDGYNVIILSWDREANQKEWEKIDNIPIRYFKLKAPYGHSSIIFYYPFFWGWVLINTVLLRPHIIHACNLDSGIVSYLCWKLGLCHKFVFDLHDGFALSYISSTKKFLFNLIHKIEDKIFYGADAGIIPSEARAIFYTRYGKKDVTVILNSPPDVAKNLEKVYDKHRFTIVHAGLITMETGDLELAEATKDLDVDVILAGRASPYVLSKLNNYPHVKYIGILPYSDALSLESIADVIVAFYKPTTINTLDNFAEPNKIYEAIMLGKPIITNVKRDVVEGYRCGITVSYGNIDGLRSAIKFLKENPKVAYELGLNGRKAYEQYFNWDVQRKKLIDLYNELLTNDTQNAK